MIVTEASFIKSATKPAQFPAPDLPEIAFAGRSNVGKSSLINTLVNRKKLVKTSSKPGCTQLINFFTVNGRVSFVDLPGYGYAKVSKKVRQQWGPMIESYLAVRETLCGVVLLVDIRRDPGREELALIDWLSSAGIACRIVLTKADKLSAIKRKNRVGQMTGLFGIPLEDIFVFSSKTRLGRDRLWQEIDALTGDGDLPAAGRDGKDAGLDDQGAKEVS